jgi:cytochrome c oxidase assembly protein subunit 15
VGVGLVAAAWFTFAVAYFQLVLGAHLRHPGVAWAPHQFRAVVVLHVVTAFVLLAQVGRVALAARRLPRPLGWPALLLGGLVVCQLLLGVAAWRAKYGWPEFLPVPFASSMTNFTVQAESMSQALTVTAHVAVGSLILGASVLYATRVSRFAYLSSRSLVGGRVEAGSESAGTPTRSVAAAQGAWA